MPVLVDSKTEPEKKDEWRTDPVLFELCHREFKFNLDAAASAENALCKRYFTQDDNALKSVWVAPWAKQTNVWCNPPFSLKREFLDKGRAEHRRGANCCFLVPADAPETDWWVSTIYDLALPSPRTLLYKPEYHVRILKPRVNFYTPDMQHKMGNNRPSALIIMGWNQPPGMFTWSWKVEALKLGLYDNKIQEAIEEIKNG